MTITHKPRADTPAERITRARGARSHHFCASFSVGSRDAGGRGLPPGRRRSPQVLNQLDLLHASIPRLQVVLQRLQFLIQARGNSRVV
jgi:hypothetical protein